MKTSFYFLVLFLIILVGCEKQKEYPNVNIEQVIKEYKWDFNYEKAKNILEKSYQLEFRGKIKQTDNKYKVYEYTGGKINGINTHRWTISFVNDSLDCIIIIVESEKVEQNQKAMQIFKKNIESLTYNKFSKIENEWIISEKENPICKVLLSGNKNFVNFFLSSNKYINKYSFM